MKRWLVLLSLIGTCYGQIENPVTREDLGFNTNLNTLWTATNASNFRAAIGLGDTQQVTFDSLRLNATTNQTLGINFASSNGLLSFSNSGTIQPTFWFRTTGSVRATINIHGIDLYSGSLSFNNNSVGQATTRANLGFSTNLNTLWTATNASDARTAIGLGATNEVTFKTVKTDALETYTTVVQVYVPIWIGDTGTNDVFQFEAGAADQAKARTNLGLGPFNGDNGFAVLTDESNNAVIATEDSKAGFYAPFHFFSDPTNAAISRTNLGLGGGITTNRTFVSYNGTNYTTNSVTISNGIITSWTQ